MKWVPFVLLAFFPLSYSIFCYTGVDQISTKCARDSAQLLETVLLA